MTPDSRAQGGPWAEWEHYRPVGPIVATFLAVIAWLVFILLFALVWSSRYSTFQDVIVTIVTLVIMGLVIGLVWTLWGMRRFSRWKRTEPPATTG